MLLIAPCLLLGSLKAHLTGVPEEQMEAAPRFGELLSDHQHEGHWPVSLTDSLRDALAMATSGRLQEAVSVWTLTEDDGAGQDAELVADFLRLTDLAGNAACTAACPCSWAALAGISWTRPRVHRQAGAQSAIPLVPRSAMPHPQSATGAPTCGPWPARSPSRPRHARPDGRNRHVQPAAACQRRSAGHYGGTRRLPCGAVLGSSTTPEVFAMIKTHDSQQRS
jgi:hypothetical protein